VKHLTVFLLMMCLALRTATAQPGADLPPPPAAAIPAEVPLDVFLEQRVAEELAADGTILSRLGVALDVELVGPQVLVSLVDPATRRAVASTKLDGLPPDREAAVASVVQVAANLAAQLTVRATPESAGVSAALAEDRRLRQEREDAEARFRQEAVWFGDSPVMFWSGDYLVSGTASHIYMGEEGRRLSPKEYYKLIGRPDLVEALHRRNASGKRLAIGGGILYVAGITLGAIGASADRDEVTRGVVGITGGIGAICVGTILVSVGLYRAFTPPISTAEAQDLGRAHNRKLREKYGLPVAVSPYVDASGGGLSVAGRF